jgi:dinuclear metal center YbgI/SA1388 family protein
MRLAELDRYFRSFLDFEGYAPIDDSLNGIQVGDPNREIRSAAFAVDACRGSFARAFEWGADFLFVHHGLFWGKPAPISGRMYERVSYLVQKGIALYACHLPLDAQSEVGNNAVLASLLGIEDKRPFGVYRGKSIGFSGRLAKPLSLAEALSRVMPDGSSPRAVYPFGPEPALTAACVSGGGEHEAFQALEAGIDLYVTGDASHELYHHVQEGRMSVISAGHYHSETWGVKALSERLSRDTGLPSLFIDLPTGL